jgi:hypothetical protein
MFLESLMRIITALSLSAVFALSACGGGSSETSLEQAFCEILASTTAEAVVATADLEGAPEVAFEDTRIEVDLLEQEDGSFAGVVAYTADEAGSFAFGFDVDVPVTVVEPSGSPLPWKAEVVGADCDELEIRRTVELGLRTVYLRIGPTDVATLSLVAEESDDDL